MNLGVAKVSIPTVKETSMAKVSKSTTDLAHDPLLGIKQLLERVSGLFEDTPAPLTRPMVVAGLRVVINEIEKCITTMEGKGE